MKIYVGLIPLISMVTPSIAAVYKCEVNGAIKYSQTRCADDAIKTDIIRYTPPTAQDLYKQDLAVQQGEIDSHNKQAQQQVQQQEQIIQAQKLQYDQQNQQYEQRKYELITQIDNINFGTGQSFDDLRNAKVLRENLQTELKMLEREHLSIIDPNGSSTRLLQDSVDQLKDEVKKSARKKSVVQDFTILDKGQTKNCQKIGAQVTCY
jgi:hypothetical protein